MRTAHRTWLLSSAALSTIARRRCRRPRRASPWQGRRQRHARQHGLFAACDAVIKITCNGNVREVVTEKVKDGVIGPLFSYQLKPVPLGIDEDGDEITSCIVQSWIRAARHRPPDRPTVKPAAPSPSLRSS